MLTLAAIVAVTGTLMLRIRRHMSRQKKPRPGLVRTDRPISGERGHHVGLPAEAMKWEVEMHETARDLSAQLDSKMSALAHLIRDADLASARLEMALEAVGDDLNQPTSDESLETPETTGANSNSAQTSMPADEDRTAEVTDERAHEELYTLADYGFDAREIARRIDIPIGEVELILRLRPQRKK